KSNPDSLVTEDCAMSQNEVMRLEFNGVTDIHLRNELRAWFHRQHSDHFTTEETLLQCVAALCYLNPGRPTVRDTFTLLQVVVAAVNSNDRRKRLRSCSYSTLRNRIDDLPRRLVKKRGIGSDGTYVISDTIDIFDGLTDYPEASDMGASDAQAFDAADRDHWSTSNIVENSEPNMEPDHGAWVRRKAGRSKTIEGDIYRCDEIRNVPR
ncbi:MAG: hypothetical protein KGI75_29660, partial [Rhizobiaceae bacterium]|nr:hypothetical protein [Rhizobiaceae bacterium]